MSISRVIPTPGWYLLSVAVLCSDVGVPSRGFADSLDNYWSDGFGSPGPDAPVGALLEWNGDLYIAGEFSQADGQAAKSVARWDGSAWHPLPGVYGTAWALAVFQDHLFAAGRIYLDGNSDQHQIVEWDGFTWHPVASVDMGYKVLCLAVYQNELYAGGDFSIIEGSPAARIARFNGTAWSPVGLGLDAPGCSGCGPRAMVEFNGELIVAGAFDQAGGTPVQDIARWDGTTWSPLAPGPGSNNTIMCLLNADSVLVAGGYFTSIGGVTAQRIARWNGSAWSSYGSGLSEEVLGIAIHDDDLYATGLGSYPVRDIARWNGTAWVGIDANFTSPVTDLLSYGGELVAAGFFSSIGGMTAPWIAAWDGAQWHGVCKSPKTMGVDRRVHALVEYNGALVVGGEFSVAAGESAPYVAMWTESGYQGLGGGMDALVYDLITFGGDLVAAGGFTMAGGFPANRIGLWDGTSWHALGPGFNHPVQALTIVNGDLIAGGLFTSSGGSPINYIARWDGTSWVSLGTGVNGAVSDLAVYQDTLVAVGQFTQAGGAPASHVATWDGSNWKELGGGLGYGPSVALPFGDDLIIGGNLFGASGLPPYPNRWAVLRWNGSRWDSLGSEVVQNVLALLEVDGKLIAAGWGDPMVAPSIARWNGSGWETLGSGTNGGIWSLGVFEGAIFVGGDFRYAGNKPSWHIGRFYEPAISAAPVDMFASSLLLLGAGYPNPFSRTVTWSLRVQSSGHVEAMIVDVTGRVVRQLLNAPFAAGQFTVEWDGLDDSGVTACAGLYMLVVKAGARVEARKVVLTH